MKKKAEVICLVMICEEGHGRYFSMKLMSRARSDHFVCVVRQSRRKRCMFVPCKQNRKRAVILLCVFSGEEEGYRGCLRHEGDIESEYAGQRLPRKFCPTHLIDVFRKFHSSEMYKPCM